jgi:hypothetical protein
MTDLALDLEHLRKDAARWPEFGSSVADLAGSGTALNYTGSGELDLIDEFLNAYNTLCAKFASRGREGESGMAAMAATLTDVVNSFNTLDTPHAVVAREDLLR